VEGHQIAQQQLTLRPFGKVQLLRIVILHFDVILMARSAGTRTWYVLVVVWYSGVSHLYYIYHARERKHKHNSENAPCEVVSCAINSNVPKNAANAP
jgi:L-asparagine transporter-like permease